MHSLMIVDDEYHIRDGLVNLVPWGTIGVEVVAEAQDGVEALDLARRAHPDVVITDISMDEGNGLDFAGHLLAERPWTRVVILSGYGEFAYAQRAVDLKVWAYLLKPVTPEDLLTKVADAVKDLDAARDRARRLGEGEPGTGAPARAVIRRALAFLEGHYADHETSLEVLADHLGLSPAYLSKLFRVETGRHYTEALAELRIRRAQELLRTTNWKTGDVGVHVGYPNPQYFATAFKKVTGRSPSEFRESSP